MSLNQFIQYCKKEESQKWKSHIKEVVERYNLDLEVAGNYYPEVGKYKHENMTLNQIYEVDPQYITWMVETLDKNPTLSEMARETVDKMKLLLESKKQNK